MICDNILEALGHTPLVRLQRMVTLDMAQVLVKYEGRALFLDAAVRPVIRQNML